MGKTNKSFLEKVIFSDNRAAWYIQSEGFYNAGLKLVESYKSSFLEKRMYSSKEIYLSTHVYKVAIYLLSHSIELLLKSIVSNHNNNICKDKPIKKPEQYGHKITNMVTDLAKVGAIIDLQEWELETFTLAEEFLKWFGRYYLPSKANMAKILKESFTEPDENEMVAFKFTPKFPETHEKLEELYKTYSKVENQHQLDVLYLLYQ